MRRDGLKDAWATSEFWHLFPGSALALTRALPWRRQAVETMLRRTDDRLAAILPASDVFVGLSSAAVRTAARARQLGSLVVIDRGARHVLSQNALITKNGGPALSQEYIGRELASYAQADLIAVPSQHAADSFLEQGFTPDQLFVCPLGVDFSRFQPTGRPPGPLKLLFVGGWSHQKGVDILVEAVRRRPDWSLTHVGMLAGAPFPKDSRFRTLGHRNHSELAPILGSCHTLVLPSRQDGFGMVLLEALAAGLPVVASRITGAPDIRQTISNPEWVEIVEPNDVDDLVRGIEKMEMRLESVPGTGFRHILTPADEEFFSWRGYASRYMNGIETKYGKR